MERDRIIDYFSSVFEAEDRRYEFFNILSSIFDGATDITSRRDYNFWRWLGWVEFLATTITISGLTVPIRPWDVLFGFHSCVAADIIQAVASDWNNDDDRDFN